MEGKKPWQSKSILVNALCGVGLALSPFVPGLESVSQFVQGHAVEIGVGWSVLNVVLRLVTKEKITLVD